MADEEKEELNLFRNGDEENELVMLGPGQKPEDFEQEDKPKQVVLTPEEYETLKKGSDSSRAVSEGLANLTQILGAQQKKGGQPVNVPQLQPGESEEDFNKRIEEMAFSGGKTAEAMAEVSRKTILPILNQVLPGVADMAKELLSLKPETADLYKKYKDSIEEEIMTLPPEQRLLPGAPKWAFDRVVARHKDDVISERVSSRLEEEVTKRVKEELAKRGIADEDDEEGGKARVEKRTPTPSGQSASQGAKKRTSVYLTAADRAKFEKMAEEKGVDLVDILRAQGKLARRS